MIDNVLDEMTMDAISGKLVIILGSREETNRILRAVAGIAGLNASKVVRGHGNESVEMISGGRVIPACSPNALRGCSPDVIYADQDMPLTEEWTFNVFVALNATGGPLIQA